MSETCKYHGHVLYCTKEDLAKYPALHTRFEFSWDVEKTWESVSYVAEKAYDFKDVGTLFVDGVSVSIMRHYDVPVGIIWLVGGLIFGLWLLHLTHKKEQKQE